jgi:hypothetical protein
MLNKRHHGNHRRPLRDDLDRLAGSSHSRLMGRFQKRVGRWLRGTDAIVDDIGGSFQRLQLGRREHAKRGGETARAYVRRHGAAARRW